MAAVSAPFFPIIYVRGYAMTPAEIAASPQVWKIDGDKYEEVDILIREQTIGRHGSLGCIEISLRPRQETRCL